MASGGNDNCAVVLDLFKGKVIQKFNQHKAAIKAIAFDPVNQDNLYTGGGTADRCIRLFDVSSGVQKSIVETDSQVCNLIFCESGKEFLSTHGYSLNQLILWDKETFRQKEIMNGHSQRILYVAKSPCNQFVATASGDQTIKIWSIFEDFRKFEGTRDSFFLR